MKNMQKLVPGILLSLLLALTANQLQKIIPGHLISAGVFALLLGMVINPFISGNRNFSSGIQFTSKKILKFSIILMGLGLSFSQIFSVGKFSLVVMTFTLASAFLGGHLLGKVMGLPWKLSSLISAGTGICGGSAIAAIAPVIEAEDAHIAYGISATFLFDILMVILFPLMGRFFQMSDLGFGLWSGTAVNDTSSVVAAAYAFSDAAGQYAVIVKLTRTLSIVPVVLIFSYIHARVESRKTADAGTVHARNKVDLKSIFPFFILFFLLMVGSKSTGLVPDAFSAQITSFSKLLMVMSLGAIGLKTNFSEVTKSGFKPMVHGFLISLLVVVVSFLVQLMMGQI